MKKHLLTITQEEHETLFGIPGWEPFDARETEDDTYDLDGDDD